MFIQVVILSHQANNDIKQELNPEPQELSKKEISKQEIRNSLRNTYIEIPTRLPRGRGSG
jgi:hypothetical protein